MICPKCNNEAGEAKFCPYCGNALNVSVPDNDVQSGQPALEPVESGKEETIQDLKKAAFLNNFTPLYILEIIAVAAISYAFPILGIVIVAVYLIRKNRTGK